MECANIPPEVAEAASAATLDLLPKKSKKQYEIVYERFQDWTKTKGIAGNINENIVLAYFYEKSKTVKSSTLWTLKVFCNKIAHTADDHDQSIQPSQWENDFFLVEPREGFLFDEYMTMIVQYSFITLFIVALPIAPLFALFNNIIELRLDAKKILNNYRRIIPKKVNGIEEWNTLIQILTILGAVSNPLLLAYSSSLIPKTIYLHRNNWSLKGYFNSTLSEFDIKGAAYISPSSTIPRKDCCQYPGKRYPPSHALKYQHTYEFWHELAVKTIFFVVLENLCLLVSLLLNYIIPIVPRKVEIKLLEDQKILRKTKLQRSKSRESLHRIMIDDTKAGPSEVKII